MFSKKCFLLLSIIILVIFNPIRADSTTRGQTLHFAISDEESTVIDRILYEAFKKLDYDISISSMGMSSAIVVAESNEKDGLASYVGGFSETHEDLIQIPVAISEANFYPLVRADSNLDITSWQSLEDFEVGYLYKNHYVNSQMEKLNSPAKFKTNNISELYELLENGDIDIIITYHSKNIQPNHPSNFKLLEPIETVATYPYLNIKHANLVDSLTKVLELMKNNGTIENITNNNIESDGSNIQKSILHISSYYPDMKRENVLVDGLISNFKDSHKYAFYTVSLNAKRLKSDESHLRAAYNSIRTSFMSARPDVVIATDNVAVSFVIDNYDTLFVDIPIVFSSTDRLENIDFGKVNGQDFTGFINSIAINQIVENMLELFPETENIFVINDYLQTGVAIQKEIKEQLEPYEDYLNIEYNENIPFEDLLTQLRMLPKNTLVLSGLYFVDSDGIYYREEEVNKKIAVDSSAPVFGIYESSFAYGQVGGKYIDTYKQGEMIGKLAFNILNGVDIKTLPLFEQAPDYSVWMFDKIILDKYNIREELLPEEAVIINQTFSFWESNPKILMLIIFLSMISSVLLASTFALIRKNLKLNDLKNNLQSSLSKANEKLETLLKIAPAAYVMEANGIILEINDYMKDSIGFEIGANFNSYCVNDCEKILIQNALQESKTAYNAIAKLKMLDGSIRRFLMNMARLGYEDEDSIVAWFIDIENSERQKDEIRNCREDLRRMSDTIPAPIFIIEPTTKEVLYANQSYLEMFELTESIESNNGKTIYSSDFYPKYQQDGNLSLHIVKHYMDRTTASGKPFTFEWQYLTKSGKLIYAQISCCRILYNGANSIIIMIKDTGEEREQSQLLLTAIKKEKEANTLKSRFLANMSHEIRTPMNAIIGLSQVALLKQQSEENSSLFKKINLSSKNLLTIINDILDMSKIEAEKLELIENNFELEEIISNSFMMASERVGIKPIEMIIEIAPDVPVSLYGDQTRLWQVLKNILDNSAKYTEKGRIILSVFKSNEKDDIIQVTFKVKDTGYGMNSKQLERLFLQFEQFHNEKSRKTIIGTGLGMSISKHLVELMGGHIEVASTENVGTETTISIPFKKVKDSVDIIENLKVETLKGKEILVLAKDSYLLKIISDILATAEILYICTSDIETALKKISDRKKHNIPFEAIIFENSFIDSGIIDLAKESLKILMTSPYLSTEDNSFSILEKPFTATNFVKALLAPKDDELDYINASFPKAKVLVCEDNELNQDVISEMLEVFDIIPTIANNAKECLELLDKQNFDLLFMDITMPEMDGYEATSIIRQKNKDIIIIAMTANVMSNEIEHCIEVGMNAHIGKPINFSKLKEQLLKYLTN